ncbi:oxidoreductase, partial [Bacteroidetes bacterium SCGC AAA795-G10]
MKKKKSFFKKIKRRTFIKNGAAASSIFILPRHVLGGTGYIAPSDKLALAAIGSGGKGASDISNSELNGKEKVVALCDVDLTGRALETVKKYPKAKRYEDFREMLDKEKSIDAVTISTPDHTHAVVAANAIKRGIHVYVQKPLTHNVYEARLLTELARE